MPYANIASYGNFYLMELFSIGNTPIYIDLDLNLDRYVAWPMIAYKDPSKSYVIHDIR